MLNLDGNVSLMANPLNEERKNILKTTRFNKKEKYNIKEDITNNDKVKPEATEELVGLLDDLKMIKFHQKHLKTVSQLTKLALSTVNFVKEFTKGRVI